ncbi:STAS domain-containing protein [Natronohydrobacter thiooxidans]|jgi:anti-sigma B factor antagonist|uniref:STAS domain-containing protein n=1 Tax=Natronohydrobacter thiooxidans TaxID=87172 RepID=UPI0008FF1AEE|nr:STAS domain-containing protein [Natronohydrobacter thiooxidans]
MIGHAERMEAEFLVIEISTARLEASNAPDLRALLIGKIDAGADQILLDLKDVKFMDSSALGALIGGIKKMGPLGTLALTGPKGAVQQLLKLTRMDKVFPIYASVPAAISDLTG